MNVMKTGVAYHAKNTKVDLIIGNELRPHYFNYSFTPLYDTQGNLYGVMNTASDVTDLNLARQQVQYSEQRLRQAIDTAGFGTYELDLKTNKIITSGNFNAIWSIDKNFSNDDLLKKMHPDDWPLRDKSHQEAILTGQMCYDARILNDDGSFKWVQINGKLISDINDDPLTLIGVVQDISEQRLFEDELKKEVEQRTEELRHSNDDLMHFANIVSHDLKEPVRKIKIFNARLRNEIDSSIEEKSRTYLDKVDFSAQRMQGIIEGILTYSHH